MDRYVKVLENYLAQKKDDTVAQKQAQSIASSFIEQAQTDSSSRPRFDLLWDAFILVAKNHLTVDDAFKVESLAELAKAIQDLGTLSLNGQPVKTDLGTAWTELPYLGAQMREAWNTAPPDSSTEQWANLNSFAAQLTAKEASDFSLFAIWTFRDALETPRPFTERETGNSDAKAKTEVDVSTDELLPAVLQWLEVSGDKLVALTIESHDYTRAGQSSPDPAFLGKLAKDVGIVKGGYSPRRWRFWRKRLEEISRAKDDSGGREKVAKLAYQGLQKLDQIDKEVNTMNEDMDGLHGGAK